MRARRRKPVIQKTRHPIEESSESSPPYRPYYVYGLAEQGGRIFYIGMTNDMNKRYQQHITGDGNLRKTGFIRKLGDRVEVKILDTTMELQQAQQLEAFWILYYTLRCDYLTNTHAGALLDMMDLDDEHTEKLATMLQERWSKEGEARWHDQRWSLSAQGSWEHVKEYSKYAHEKFPHQN